MTKPSKPSKRLYHYTSRVHLERIEADGFLRPTESNIGHGFDHQGPDVVWLTDRPSFDQDWKTGSIVDKTEVRFTVEVPDAEWWPTWSKRQGIADWWYKALDRAGGYASDRWYVVARSIPRSEWVAVELRDEVRKVVSR